MNDEIPRIRRARLMLAIVAVGLFISAVTIWPAIWELKTAVHLFWGDSQPTGTLHRFLIEIIAALQLVETDYPFLLYGYDWLAFAHLVLAILFLGAMRDPVRNVWVIQFGLICCLLVPPFAAVFIWIRNIPSIWFCFDFAFAPAAGLPLLIA